MKNIYYNLDSKINETFSLKLNKKWTISEQQILELQDLFLSNGVHHISVPSIKEGRALIYKFLDALRCYQSIACFTAHGTSLKKTMLDLHKQLAQKNWDYFFIEEFYSDFLWVEQEGNHYKNCIVLEQKIYELGIDQHIPIIVLSPYSMDV